MSLELALVYRFHGGAAVFVDEATEEVYQMRHMDAPVIPLNMDQGAPYDRNHTLGVPDSEVRFDSFESAQHYVRAITTFDTYMTTSIIVADHGRPSKVIDMCKEIIEDDNYRTLLSSIPRYKDMVHLLDKEPADIVAYIAEQTTQ